MVLKQLFGWIAVVWKGQEELGNHSSRVFCNKERRTSPNKEQETKNFQLFKYCCKPATATILVLEPTRGVPWLPPLYNLFSLEKIYSILLNFLIIFHSSMENLLGLLRIHVERGVNLAIRDVVSSDPYVVIKMGKQVRFLHFSTLFCCSIGLFFLSSGHVSLLIFSWFSFSILNHFFLFLCVSCFHLTMLFL